MVQRPRNTDSLTLSARQPDAPLTDDGLVAIWKLDFDEIVELGNRCRTFEGDRIDLIRCQSESDIRRNLIVR